MPTVMWGIGGAAMEIVQQPERITLLSELANQSRRIYLDGRMQPADLPDQRVGFSVGHWEGDTLVIETTNVTEWEAPRWPHSDAFRVTERWYFKNASDIKITALLATALLFAGTVAAQEGGPGTTRLLVTHVRVPPAKVGQWLELQRNEVVPALKKAGIKDYTRYQTVVGEVAEFVIVRPFAFAEFHKPDPLDAAMGSAAAAALRAMLGECTESMHRSIENRHDDLYLNPGAAAVLFVSRYRAMPGRQRDYMSLVRTEMYPVMKQAQQDGTFAGLSVTTSVQGGEPNIITLNMHYATFAPLDGPPPVAKTLGPQGTAAFLAKGAGLISQLDQSILRRVPDLSF